MATIIQFKRAASPGASALAEGEPAFTTGQNRLYIGDTDDGNAPMACRMKLDGTAAPGATDDADDGFSVGSVWVDTTNDKAYVCVDATATAAVWKETSNVSGSSPPFNDSTVLIQDAADNTKTMRFELGGFLPASARVLTPQDADYTLENTGHASKHVSGGSDSIKLDDLAAPDDNTDLNASALSHGLMPKLTGSTTTFFRSDGTQATPAGTLDINGLTLGYFTSGSDTIAYYDVTAAANRKAYPGYIAQQTATMIHGRISTESGVPVSTSDRAGQSTLYWVGDGLLPGKTANGWTWTTPPSSVALSGLTTGKNYDVFFDAVGGMDLGTAWTNDTTRALALSTDHGLVVNNASFTRVIGGGTVSAGYGVYLGTIRAVSATTTDDTEAKRFVWNFFSRVRRPIRKLESTDSWSYTTASWRQMNNSTANQVAVIQGYAGHSCLDLWAHAYASSTSANLASFVGIGEDGTSAIATGCVPRTIYIYPAGGVASGSSHLVRHPGIGYHYYAQLEYGNTGFTFYGDAGAPTLIQNGLQGVWEC